MAAGPEGPVVDGLVVIATGCPAMTDATVHISLEDVSYADAPATVVAEADVLHVEHRPQRPDADRGSGGTVVPFALRPVPGAPVIDPRRHYAVRVWVDRDGDGREGPGDLHSDQRHPVLTRGHPRTVTIELGAG